MVDILHDFVIRAPRSVVFRALSTSTGLDSWWTLDSTGEASEGAEWCFGFGPDFQWRGRVEACIPDEAMAWEITRADADWMGTRIAFRLEPSGGMTRVRFAHTGWPEANAHFRTSSYCWAMYLRVLRTVLEGGPPVSYGDRLEA